VDTRGVRSSRRRDAVRPHHRVRRAASCSPSPTVPAA
jgi:hypothetical protein